MKALYIIYLICITLAFAGCRSADRTAPVIRPPGSGTYMVNEGGFGGGGNLSFYDQDAGSVSTDVVRNPDSWFFPNDILFRTGKMYVAVNGSDKIAVIDPVTDSVRSDIVFPPGTGPGLLVAQGERLYSANYNGTVTVIDPVSDTILFSSGAVVGFPGGIVGAAGGIFVSDLGAWPDTGRSVKLLDLHTLTVIGSVEPGNGPARMVLAGGKLYVGASTAPRVWKIDPVSLAIEDSAELGAIPGDIASDGNNLFILTSDAVERVPFSPFVRDSVAFIARSEGLFHYALGYDTVAGQLYVSTVISAGGSGIISVFSRTGIRNGASFPSGIFPGAFGFYIAGAP